MSAVIAEQEIRVKVTPVFDRLQGVTKPIVICVGGAGSSKSFSIAQKFIERLCEEKNKVFGISRKTMPALRMTAMTLMINLLKAYGIYERGEHNKSDNTFKYRSNLIQFFGLDEPDKIKSFNANCIWLEEANEFTWEDFTILRLRLNRPEGKEQNQLFMSFNPVDCWIWDKLENDPNAEWLYSNYLDNPFLSDSYVSQLEGLKHQDLNYYNIYALGKRGMLENIIYPTWILIDEMPFDAEYERYGIDFGYENPSVVLDVMVTGNDLYADELLYQTHMTNAELIDFCKELKPKDAYADSSEPQRIEELNHAGIRCEGAIKDVKLGIDLVKRHNIHITKRSANLIKEIRSYQRKKDKQDNLLDEPIKFSDHCMDSLRYSLSWKLKHFSTEAMKAPVDSGRRNVFNEVY